MDQRCVILELCVEPPRTDAVKLDLGRLKALQAGFELTILIQNAALVHIDEVTLLGVPFPVLQLLKER